MTKSVARRAVEMLSGPPRSASIDEMTSRTFLAAPRKHPL
jgi:hypothetical protein